MWGLDGSCADRGAKRYSDANEPLTQVPVEAGRRSCASWSRSGVDRLGSEVHRDVLRLEVLVHPLRAALAAEARLLDAAEGRARVGGHALVEADHLRLELLDDAERAIDVAGEDVRHQAVLGVVGRGDRLLLGLEALDRSDRAEDLLAQQAGVLGHVS